MSDNRIVVYKGTGKVAVETLPYPKLEVPAEVADAMGMSRKADHGVILKCVSTNICGSDQHMVRGRTTAPIGQTLGHEITGEVVEKGSDVQFVDVGDICSVPFNIACGRCRNCREGQTGICLNVNPARAGSAYGYVDMGGWLGGQADFVMVPFADFNLLKFPTGTRHWPRFATSPCCRTSSPPGTTAPRPQASPLDRRCMSPEQARWVWPRRTRRNCSGPPS